MTTDFCSVEVDGHQCIREAGHDGRHRCWHGLLVRIPESIAA